MVNEFVAFQGVNVRDVPCGSLIGETRWTCGSVQEPTSQTWVRRTLQNRRYGIRKRVGPVLLVVSFSTAGCVPRAIDIKKR
jgi:hypothetical protein